MTAVLLCSGHAHTLSSCWSLSTSSRPPHLMHITSAYILLIARCLPAILCTHAAAAEKNEGPGLAAAGVRLPGDRLQVRPHSCRRRHAPAPHAVETLCDLLGVHRGNFHCCRVAKKNNRVARERREGNLSAVCMWHESHQCFLCPCAICSQLHKVTWEVYLREHVRERYVSKSTMKRPTPMIFSATTVGLHDVKRGLHGEVCVFSDSL